MPAWRARLEELKRIQAAAVAPVVPPRASVLASPVAPTPAPAPTKPPAGAAAAPAAKPLPAPAPSIYEAAQAWAAAARETKNPAVLEDFLGRFGDTIYGPMARDRLQQLKSTEVAVVAP